MKKFILLIIIFLVFVINFGIFFFRFSTTHPQRGLTPLEKEEEKETLEVLAQKIKAGKERARALLEKVAMPPEGEVGTEELVLQGILYGGSSSFALINDEVVRKGDEIGEVKVVKIKKEEEVVVLLRGETLFTLEMITVIPGHQGTRAPGHQGTSKNR